MYTDYEIRHLPLTVKRNRQAVEAFLAANGLRLDDVDYYAALYPCGEEEIVAGGGLCGDVIKCIAVSEAVRDEGLSNRLVSHLVSVATADGHTSVKLFTKPENRALFESLGFTFLAEAPEAIFMENGQRGIAAYCYYLRSLCNPSQSPSQKPYGPSQPSPEGRALESEGVQRRETKTGREGTGVIVMNANPFTRGHRYLVEQAAAQVERLYVIAVKEEKSLFSYAERLAMMQAGCRDLTNVTVCEGSDYAVSAATFPTYFLKQIDDATDTHIALDLDLFARHIAPALEATVRFVGTEPTDTLTARYNRRMNELLPARGIRVVEIERLSDAEGAVSASRVRRCLHEGRLPEAARLVSPVTVPYLLSQLATDALQQELDTTPKPGLVDRQDNGAHRDMDHALMSKSIRTLRPYFTRLARLGFQAALPAIEEVREAGQEAEAAMLRATTGVNTHKGALFSLGLMTVAAAHLLCKEAEESRHPLQTDNNKEENNRQENNNQQENNHRQEEIRRLLSKLAEGFPTPTGTHGSRVRRLYAVKGAVANAREAYPDLFGDWLPFYRAHRDDTYALHKTLLRIMSSLDDTNIYYRRDAATVARVRREAAEALEHFSVEALEEMNRTFIRENISPGGSADMLALTLLADAVTSQRGASLAC